MANSIVQFFEDTVQKHKDRPAARYKDISGTWITKTWSEFSDDRKLVASGLIALGLKPHDRVNLLSNTSYRWMVSDLGILSAGGETVAIYQTSTADEVRYIVNDSDAVMIFVEDVAQLAKIQE